MPNNTHTFVERGGWVLLGLAHEFGLTLEQAAGIVGNLGFESNQFKALQEIGVSGFERGGYGWAQWTGPRRRQFEAYAEAIKLSPATDEANYGFLIEELKGAYAYVLMHLKKTTTIEAAVFTFGFYYETPGGTTSTHLPGYDDRLKFANIALQGAKAAIVVPPPPVVPQIVIPPTPVKLTWWQRIRNWF